MGQVLLGVDWILPTTHTSCIDKDGIRHDAVGADPVQANVSDIAALEAHAFLPCGVPAPRMPVAPAVAGRVPESVRSEKLNVS
jgi:hypothetical protein